MIGRPGSTVGATVGYSVYPTGENRTISPSNLPNLTFEIDPNVGAWATEYASLVFVPDALPADASSKWTAIDAVTSGKWGLTGSAPTTCRLSGTLCTFSEMQAALDDGGEDAVVTFPVAFVKGRDHAFSGAVDGLKINERTFDFEPFGVTG